MSTLPFPGCPCPSGPAPWSGTVIQGPACPSSPGATTFFQLNVTTDVCPEQYSQVIGELLGTGPSTTFNLAKTPLSSSSIWIYIAGVRKFLTDDFTVVGKTITLLSTPAGGAKIYADYWVGDGTGTVALTAHVVVQLQTIVLPSSLFVGSYVCLTDQSSCCTTASGISGSGTGSGPFPPCSATFAAYPTLCLTATLVLQPGGLDATCFNGQYTLTYTAAAPWPGPGIPMFAGAPPGTTIPAWYLQQTVCGHSVQFWVFCGSIIGDLMGMAILVDGTLAALGAYSFNGVLWFHVANTYSYTPPAADWAYWPVEIQAWTPPAQSNQYIFGWYNLNLTTGVCPGGGSGSGSGSGSGGGGGGYSIALLGSGSSVPAVNTITLNLSGPASSGGTLAIRVGVIGDTRAPSSVTFAGASTSLAVSSPGTGSNVSVWAVHIGGTTTGLVTVTLQPGVNASLIVEILEVNGPLVGAVSQEVAIAGTGSTPDSGPFTVSSGSAPGELLVSLLMKSPTGGGTWRGGFSDLGQTVSIAVAGITWTLAGADQSVPSGGGTFDAALAFANPALWTMAVAEVY
jgi:hypothetical protein